MKKRFIAMFSCTIFFLLLLLPFIFAQRDFSERSALLHSNDFEIISSRTGIEFFDANLNKRTPVLFPLNDLMDFIEEKIQKEKAFEEKVLGKKLPEKVFAEYKAVKVKEKPLIQVNVKQSFKFFPWLDVNLTTSKLLIEPLSGDFNLFELPKPVRKFLKAYDESKEKQLPSFSNDLNVLKYRLTPKYKLIAKTFDYFNFSDENISVDENIFYFPQDDSVFSGDGVFPVSSGTTLNASNGVTVFVQKMFFDKETKKIYIFFNVLINGEQINLYPLLFVPQPPFTDLQVKTYGVMLSISSNDFLPAKEIIQKIEQEKKVMLSITSLILQPVSSCNDLFELCLEKNDLISCTSVCPKMLIEEMDFLETEKTNFFFSKNLTNELKDSVPKAFSSCYSAVNDFLQVTPFTKLVSHVFSEEDCPECNYYMMMPAGIQLTMQSELECSESIAHEIAHFFVFPPNIHPKILEEGRAQFVAKKVKQFLPEIPSSKEISCSENFWKFAGEKPFEESISEETVCLNNASIECGSKTLWQIAQNTPLEFLKKKFSNNYSIQLTGYSSEDVNFNVLDEFNELAETVSLKPLQYYAGNGFLVHFGQMINSEVNLNLISLLLLDNAVEQCFVEKKNVCHEQLSSYSENPFTELDKAVYGQSAINTALCFFEELESMHENIVIELSSKMAQKLNSNEFFCTEEFLKKYFSEEQLALLKQKYGLENYFNFCKVSGIPAGLIGCQFNLGCYSYLDPEKGWVEVE